MNDLLAMPREWLAATGDIAGFTSHVVRDVWTGATIAWGEYKADPDWRALRERRGL